MTEPAADIAPLPRPAPSPTGWTGGQYSLVRALLGTGLAAWFAAAAVAAWRAGGDRLAAGGAGGVAGVGLACTGALAALTFAAGLADRASALTAFVSGTLLTAAGLAAPGAGGLAIGGVLLAHLATPPAPYGSWAARDRADASAGWKPTRGWWHAVWVVLALAHIDAALRLVAGAPATDGDPARIPAVALAIAVTLAALLPWLRAVVFVGAGLVQAGWLLGLMAGAVMSGGVGAGAVGGALDRGAPCATTVAIAFLVALMFGFDPAWVAGRPGGTPAILFYDGTCGLCHRAVRFVVAEDPRGRVFRFAPLQSEILARHLDEARRRALPDSLVVLTGDGRVLTRAAAVLFILGTLGGWWTIAARVGGLVPRALGDALYDVVARGRRRWFAAPAEACPVVAKELRARFLDQGQGADQGQDAARNAVP